VTGAEPAEGPREEERGRLAHLAAVIDASGDAILSKTLEGVITSWNASAERIFGYTADEIVGRNIRLLIPEDRQAEEDDILAKLRAGRFIEHYETVRLTKDGTRLDVSLSISPVKDETGTIVGASKIVRDITQRKRADEALIAAVAKFESVFNQSGIFAGIMDPDGTLIEINVLALDYCGYTREEVLDRPFWQTPWWRGSEEMRERIRDATQQAAGGDAFRETMRYWLADGTERIVDFAMHPIRDELGVIRFLHPTGIDITERERAEQRFRSLVSIVTDVPWTADSHGRFEDSQPSWADYTGQAWEEYRGLGWLDAVYPEDREQVREAWARATSSGDLFQATGRLWHAASREHRYVAARATPVHRADGSVDEWVGACTDVHERTVAEEALRAQEAEEREIAVGLQRALLPGHLVSAPRLALAARYEAGSDVLEVGGDWYDAFDLPDGRIGLTVGDVVGHGLIAAAAMGQLRTALAALAQETTSPGELLSRLDGFLARTRTTDFATVCYAILDPETGEVEYASAGHPPMLAVSPSRETAWLDGAQSPPLTGYGAALRQNGSATLAPGSLLILYSDGLVERRRERPGVGLARLEQAALTLGDAAVDEVCDRLVAALGLQMVRNDDVALLAVRLLPDSASTFHRVFPGHPEELRGLRSAMREWMDEQALPEPVRDALLLAVGEACANAVEHAYRDVPSGDVHVDIVEDADRSFVVAIRDFGRFQSGSASEDRGRGTEIMRTLTTDFSRDSTPSGTTVRFRLPMDVPTPA